MKLKPIKINNNYILVDDVNPINPNDYWIYICPINGIDYGDDNSPIVRNVLHPDWFNNLHDKNNYYKVICAENEFNLELPILPKLDLVKQPKSIKIEIENNKVIIKQIIY